MSNIREAAITALRSNPLVFFTNEHLQQLPNSKFDVTFKELGMDSLARMELSIWLEVELGLEVTESRIYEMKSLAGLIEFLEFNLKSKTE